MRLDSAVGLDSAGRDDFDALAEGWSRARQGCGPERARRLRDEMIAAAMPLAERVARRFRSRAESLADLEQVARLGLVKAVDRYDPALGSFTAYAVNTMLGELKRHLRDHSWGVHVPRRMQDAVRELHRHEAALTRELGRAPTDAQLAQRAGVAPGELDRIRVSAAAYHPVSLNMPIGETGTQLADLFGELDRAVENAADRLTAADLISCLPGRERHIVSAIFFAGRVQTQVAAELGISQMQVSRALARALAWLREGLLTDQVPRWPVTAGAPFDVRATLRPGRALEITVVGEVDRDNAGLLRATLLDLIRRQPPGQRVVLRLRRVPLLDAAGVRVLLAVYQAACARGVLVTATGVNPLVRRLATSAGLGPMMQPG
ncbi:RNA polymerase sigma-B factor [Actinoplanes octamycinicus]|uniref:RNA polymerase sigma-B factor n=1 Tax=Actinoplanes octamycinicus TaxID=135948 RepID=A0A7W7M9D8_9ACTN|nr:sigma-70 family RNA polymerase sigma factor [Actinoplanes octamycinicus]MBB4741720.1 RNA polymerase sigma-B factor [Actinoplanes octamycinicus]